MNASIVPKLVPVLAAVALLWLAVAEMRTPAPAPAPRLAPELRTALGERLEAGHAKGYVELLEQAFGPRVFELQLRDRDGRLLAEWPPALTRSGWGPFAPALQALRSGFWRLVGEREVETLFAGGRPVGELAVIQLRGAGFAGRQLAALLAALLAVWALLLALRRVPAAGPVPAPAPAPRPPARGSIERLGLRLGPALDQAELGVVLLNARQQIRYLNQAASDLCGWSRDEALNMPVYSVLRVSGPDAGEGHPFTCQGQQPLSERLALTLTAREGETHALDVTVLRLRQRQHAWAGMLLLLGSRDAAREAIERLDREAQLATTTLDALGEGVAVCDRYGRILRVNRRLNRLFAYGEGELAGMAISKLLPVPFLNEPSVTLEHYLGERQEGRPRVVGWRKNATTFPVDLQVHELQDPESRYLLLISDSGDRLRHDNLSMRLGRLLDYAAEEIYIFDAHSLYFTEANREAQENLGYSMEQLGRMTPLHLAPGLDRAQLDADLNALRNGERRQVAYRTEHRRANGTLYPVSLRLSYSPEEEPPVFMALAQDITDQRAAEMRLEYMAHNDVLTSLPNRAALTAHLEHLLRLPASAGQVSLFFLDLDRFKQINDRYGHAAGDEVLVEFTRRVRERLPQDHFLARLSGDEFVIAALGTDTIEVERTAESLLEAMQAPFETGEGKIDIGVCIGIAHREPEDTSSMLMHRADVAMYEAKSRGGQCWVLAGADEARNAKRGQA